MSIDGYVTELEMKTRETHTHNLDSESVKYKIFKFILLVEATRR